jgi:hypothetical protein
MMRVECAWCKKDMGSKSDEGAAPGGVSHGICEACRMRVTDDLSRSLTHERPRPKGEPPVRRRVPA